jgi:hypothetical protein
MRELDRLSETPFFTMSHDLSGETKSRGRKLPGSRFRRG